MEYNTTRNHLEMREYGRHIQKMIDHLLAIGATAQAAHQPFGAPALDAGPGGEDGGGSLTVGGAARVEVQAVDVVPGAPAPEVAGDVDTDVDEDSPEGDWETGWLPGSDFVSDWD